LALSTLSSLTSTSNSLPSSEISLVRRFSSEPGSPSSQRSRSSSLAAADAARIVELESQYNKLKNDHTKLMNDVHKWKRIVALSTGKGKDRLVGFG
jgi:hypothetical protein